MSHPGAYRTSRRVTGGLLLASLAWLGTASAEDGNAAAVPATVAASRAALAADDRVVELNERGSALYAEGDYRRAVELFLQAYAVGSDPNLLFNIAACYEGLGDRDAAVEKYRAFLADPGADPAGRPRADGAIQRLLANAGDTAPPLEPTMASTSDEPSPLPTEPAPPLAGPVPKGSPEWLPWVVLGGGAALTATGVAIYALGVSDHHEVTEAPGYDEPDAVVHSSREHAEALVDSGHTKKVLGASAAALGGAVIAGYLVWTVLERPDEPPNTGVDVALSRTAASLALSGRF